MVTHMISNELLLDNRLVVRHDLLIVDRIAKVKGGTHLQQHSTSVSTRGLHGGQCRCRDNMAIDRLHPDFHLP